MRTKHFGISLIEVLAAIFVVSVGLLGVLAVIPFGAVQVSQANHADYASNMLLNAAQEIHIREMAKPAKWGIVGMDVGSGVVLEEVPSSNPPDYLLDCTKILWYEPRDINDPPHHIFCISSWVPDNWTEEVLRGQDDLFYTSYDDKRPDFAGQDGKILSSGKYTWFFTFLPQTDETTKTQVPLDSVKPATIDILACYNRVPGDDRQVNNFIFDPSFQGGSFTFDNSDSLELLTQTKYVFMTWGGTNAEGGAWCKIVFLDKKSSAPKIVVTGTLPNSPVNMQMYIPSGVLYHKQLQNVPIR